MREFTKHLILALKEDEWVIRDRYIQHVKSFLVIDMQRMQPSEVPFEFNWFERKVIGYYVRKLRDRVMLAKLVEYRLNPRTEKSYEHLNTFL